MPKHRCDTCTDVAVWSYMPGKGMACNDCVPRGCSCNMELKDGMTEVWNDKGIITNPNSDYEERTDEHGRKLPCCEWSYDPAGFDKEDDTTDVIPGEG